MQIAADTLLFVFANFDNLLFELPGMLQQLYTCLNCQVLGLDHASGQRDEEKEGESNGNLPHLKGKGWVGMACGYVSPRPAYTGKPCHQKGTLLVAKPY